METTNLAELYDAPPMAWDNVLNRLDAGFEQVPDTNGPGRHTCWLSSINSADGTPHVNALGATWVDGAFWFVTGRSTRRGRNLAHDPHCVLALSLREFDLVVEGQAVPVTDPDVVARLARRWAEDEGWPCRVDESGTALTAPFSAQSAGRPPWHVYKIDARTAHAVQTVEPFGATRWRF